MHYSVSLCHTGLLWRWCVLDDTNSVLETGHERTRSAALREGNRTKSEIYKLNKPIEKENDE
jgi:hypothetical protein